MFSVRFSLYCLVCFQSYIALAQQIKFSRVIDGSENNLKVISSIAQDQQGYIWFGSYGHGFYQYDGRNLKSYTKDSLNKNSLVDNNVSALVTDSRDIVWVGTLGFGLEKYDQSTKTFTHFRHDPRNKESLGNDSISLLLVDHLGDLWIGTRKGLDRLDKKTGKFIHYIRDANNATSLSNDHVFSIYEDRHGTLWVGCGIPSGFGNSSDSPLQGGLNKFDRNTGKFTRYMHDAAKDSTLTNNNVTAIFEDSKGNFWIGTGGDGLHLMNRETGKFAHFPYNPAHPEKLSRPALFKMETFPNYITFISEDNVGGIWIAGFAEGMNRYDPVTKKITHFGNIIQPGVLVQRDAISGIIEPGANSIGNTMFRTFNSKDGLFWVGTSDGNIYKADVSNSAFTYNELKTGTNTFYEENDSILWIGTDVGLIKRNRMTGIDKKFINVPGNSNSLSNNLVNVLREGRNGLLWIATSGGGLNKLDIRKNIFTKYAHDSSGKESPAGNRIFCMHTDKNGNLWIGIEGFGIDKMNTESGKFQHYRHDNHNSNSIRDTSFNCITSDRYNNIWIGTPSGLDRLDENSGKFDHYLEGSEILSVCADSDGVIWAGATNGLYIFNPARHVFEPFKIADFPFEIKGILHILEDDQKNLWLSTGNSILRINARRDTANVFGKKYNVHDNTFYFADNYKTKNGELLFGDQAGYYAFHPNQLKETKPPQITITSFRLGDKEQIPSKGSVLKLPVWKTDEIRLKHNQNIFSFEFPAIDYVNNGSLRYFFMLENYENSWRNLGSDHQAYFFHVPPGRYIFHVKAVNGEGNADEKGIEIIISPPWWRTWWAYGIFTLSFIGIIWTIFYYRSKELLRENKMLEEKVMNRTAELNRSLTDLKETQYQLVQSEKMASLGQLTAGIAHEIQNPLNFVNNFSEINKELVDEATQEIGKGNMEEVKYILGDIKDNSEKINHHGKRADAIVKGMLQHSRQTSGAKEPTDINALCYEYIRLSYHGLRAKDKNFNAEFKTALDENIGKINIAAPDIGRVLLNLFNNAFYAVSEKQKTAAENFKPLVFVQTKKINDKIEIKVVDNGNGISQKIVDKIFQPFFTTKPTGQGTGLGLSLSYDIIKAHSGEIKVETKEGEGTNFIIQLPIQ